MTSTLNQISADQAFVNGFKAQMAYYKHMCRISQLTASQLALYAPDVQDAVKRWNTLSY